MKWIKNKDKRRIYIISSVIFAVLLSLFFIQVKSSRILTAIVIVPLAVATLILVKRRRAFSFNKKDVIQLSATVSVVYIILKEMTGLYFGYYKNPYFVNTEILLEYILPLTTIIVASELIRSVLLAQKNLFAGLITFASCVFADVLCFYRLSGITNINRFMDLVGLTLFPAITANVYYHFIAKRYGALPNIVFRGITTLYTYFMPTITQMSDALTSCIKIFLPILLLVLVAAMFEKRKKIALQKGKKASAVAMVITISLMLAISMLISCQFRYGAIVIATESMTGEINKGDMIIYERYEDQKIEEGQVIVFLDGVNQNRKVIHRVVEIVKIGNETRYFTKGDANDDKDFGYRTEEDIFGLTDFKVAYIGYPTLWLRELLKGSK